MLFFIVSSGLYLVPSLFIVRYSCLITSLTVLLSAGPCLKNLLSAFLIESAWCFDMMSLGLLVPGHHPNLIVHVGWSCSILSMLDKVACTLFLVFVCEMIRLGLRNFVTISESPIKRISKSWIPLKYGSMILTSISALDPAKTRPLSSLFTTVPLEILLLANMILLVSSSSLSPLDKRYDAKPKPAFPPSYQNPIPAMSFWAGQRTLGKGSKESIFCSMHMKLKMSLLNSLSFVFTGFDSSSKLNILHTLANRCFPAHIMGAKIDPLVSNNCGINLLRFCRVQWSSVIFMSIKFGPSNLPLFLTAKESLMLGDRLSSVRFHKLPNTCSPSLCSFSIISGSLVHGSTTDFIFSLYFPQAVTISSTVLSFSSFVFLLGVRSSTYLRIEITSLAKGDISSWHTSLRIAHSVTADADISPKSKVGLVK